MPTIQADRLEALAQQIFVALGVPAEDARWIATLLVRANLRGHDSHGVIRIPQYASAVKRGEANPKPTIRVVSETPTTALVDGDFGFGQVVARRATGVAVAKARAQGLSAVGCSRTNHIGRLADYAELAAAQGSIAMLWVNAPTALSVVPWGGIARRLGTNPLAVAVPGRSGPALSLDMATSVVAEGKVRVKRNRKEPTPPGWIIDAAGHPATDPQAYYREPRGALLPLGEHKGYGLGLVVEILGGILSGTGAARPEPGPVQNGVFILCLDAGRFLPLEQFHEEVERLIAHVKSAPRAPGVTEILVPGEPEERATAARRAGGIFVEEETWNQIQAVARDLGVGVPSPSPS